PYKIAQNDEQNEEDELSEVPRSREALIRELIAFRLSHGFQLVVGAAVAEFAGKTADDMVNIFDKDYMAEDGAMVFMSVGNVIHQLLCVAGGEVEVRRFKRKPTSPSETPGSDGTRVVYEPFIRTALAKEYETRQIVLKSPRVEHNWNYIDHFLAGYHDDFSDVLRFWRARFVLIPVEPPKTVRRLATVNEDSEEETRLEGIRKLTQMWQRYRFISPEERLHQKSLRLRPDTNPLAIEYQTRDPSAVVAAYADGFDKSLLAEGDSNALPSQLFAEAELYHSSNFDLHKLAQDVQAERPKGVKLIDRRWHWKYYYNCFRGDEFTSWLLQHFKDIETRDTAVELGEKLLQLGLFQHVQQKHKFRDGHFFYHIAKEYLTPHMRSEARTGWFRRSDRSVFSTPIADGARGSPIPDRSRSRSATENSSTGSGHKIPTGPESGIPKLELSHVLRYDVDHRKRSYRPELINLHYDRIHNPDNCYHIRIDWMNVTAKLIEDAIVTWATTAERYGLKLVELPIAEASSISEAHPFRAPYLVKLVVSPPEGQPLQYFEPTSFNAPQSTDRHFYQKAVLKKFNFVLDLEAANSFTAKIDVSYSWGKPDYRFTQFIHKSGVLLAQITDEGHLLFLANRLCNNRAAASDKFDKAEGPDRRFALQSALDRPSPCSSPPVRAVPDNLLSPFTHAGADKTIRTPEEILEDMEAFCQDPKALKAFYEDASKTGAFADPQDFPQTSMSSTRRRTVLITRTFAVSMADGQVMTDTTSEQTPTPQSSVGKENGFPFPASDSADGEKRTSQRRLRPTRSPMYAVAIVAKLPIAPSLGLIPPSRSGPARPGARTSESFTGADSAGSSLDSDRRAGWILLDPAFGSDSMPSFGPANDVDSGVDAIAQHWDVISRTLTSMQLVIQEKILALLKIADAASPPALHSMRPPLFRPGGRDQNLQPMQSRSIKLQPGALSEDADLKRLASLAAERVVRGIKIPRVVTGQERWGVWRDEARSIGKWAGSREQNFFFYNLLSSFLGNHTEWLNNIGPIDYRRRHYDQQRSSPSEELTVASRTVIVSSDKMTARRLIFLLSAFFPVSSHVNFTSPSIRPVTSSSSPGFSQSPPSNMPISRRESLRRTMNRRGRPSSSSTKLQGQGRERTSVNRESPDYHAQGVSFDLSHSKLVSRRESDVQSTKTANMPILFGVEVTRKSSAATTSTVTPSEAVPVAHFNIPSGSATEARPGSSGSASANLMSRLQRNNSVSASNVGSSFQSGSRWSSLSFWRTGSRRESSTTERSDLPASSMASEKPLSGTHGDKPVVKGHQRENTLERMVKEVGKDHTVYQDDTEDSELQPDHTTPQSPEPTFNFSKDDPSLPSQPEPDRPAFASSYLKMSVDEKDGIIDVELPMDNFGFGSPLQSPSMGCFASVSSLGGSSWGQNSSYSCSPADAEHPLNVAGWLEFFHPDFALQAVKPYTEFDKDVRRAMSAEPTPLTAVSTPTLDQGPTERWVDVCTTLVADAQSYTIKRLRLRRRVRLIPTPGQPAITPGPYAVPTRSQYGSTLSLQQVAPAIPMIEHNLEEQFSEDPIVGWDSTLIDAVERVIAQSGQSSKVPSVASSRSSSRQDRHHHRSASGALPALEVPRGECRAAVLGALKEVVKGVFAEYSRHEPRDAEEGATAA
ncbi:hypothetical protein B0A49_13643, partial [Cryomyces minteri]